MVVKVHPSRCRSERDAATYSLLPDKKTAGVDGVKSLKPKQRLELVGQLRISNKARPARRVWIPKPGRDEKRPLGIPIMYDKCLLDMGDKVFYHPCQADT